MIKAGMIDRMCCLIVVLCILLLDSERMLSHFQNPVLLVAYRTALELTTIITIIRLVDASVVRDLIDISIYLLFFRMTLLGTAVYHPPLYGILKEMPVYLLSETAYILALLRIIWLKRGEGVFLWADWPPIGLCGWTHRHLSNPEATTPWQYVVTLIIICVQLAFIVKGHDTDWEIAVPACAGLLLIMTYGYAFKSNVVKSLTQQQQDALTIEELSQVIMKASETIAFLQARQAQNPPDDPPPPPPPLRRVK